MVELIIKRSGISLYLIPTAIYIDGEKKAKIGNHKPSLITLPEGMHEMTLKCSWFPFYCSKHKIVLSENKNVCLIKERNDTFKFIYCITVILSILGLLLDFLNSYTAGIIIWGGIILMLLFDIFTINRYFKINFL